MHRFLLHIVANSDLFQLTFFNRTLKVWLIAILLFLVLLAIKGLLANLILLILQKTIFRNKALPESKRLKKTLSWGIPLLGLALINLTWIKIPKSIAAWLEPIYLSLFIIWLLFLAEILIRQLLTGLSHKKPDRFTPTMLEFIIQIFRAVLILLGLIMILNQFKINVAGIITGLGIGGLAISMAAKDVIADLIGGFTIMSERIFEIGDYVKTPGFEGTIERLRFRQSEIRSVDDGLIIVPNSLLTENYVINVSRMRKRRIDLIVHLPFLMSNQQITELKAKIEGYLTEHPHLIPDSAVLAIDQIEKEDICFRILYYIALTDYNSLLKEKDTIYQMVLDYVKEQNLEIPRSKIDFSTSIEDKVTDE